MAKYLDYEGLKHFVGKIKGLVNGKADESHTHSIKDVTNLQTELSGKAEKKHVHKCYEIEIDTGNNAYDHYYEIDLELIIDGMVMDIYDNKDNIDKKINFIGQIPFKNAQIIEKGASTSGIPNETMIYELE